jgi:hypothetical protein
MEEVQESAYIETIAQNYSSRPQMCSLIEIILRYLDNSTRYTIKNHKYIYNNARRWIIYPYENNYIDPSEDMHKLSYIYKYYNPATKVRESLPKDFITGCLNLYDHKLENQHNKYILTHISYLLSY